MDLFYASLIIAVLYPHHSFIISSILLAIRSPGLTHVFVLSPFEHKLFRNIARQDSPSLVMMKQLLISCCYEGSAVLLRSGRSAAQIKLIRFNQLSIPRTARSRCCDRSRQTDNVGYLSNKSRLEAGSLC